MDKPSDLRDDALVGTLAMRLNVKALVKRFQDEPENRDQRTRDRMVMIAIRANLQEVLELVQKEIANS